MKTFKHSGSMGDVLYACPSIASITKKAVLYLQGDIPDTIPAWAGTRQPTRMSTDQAESLLPLLRSQPYIHRAEIWRGEEVDYNLDEFRLLAMNLAGGDIARYIPLAFPEADPVLWEPWLTVEPDKAYEGVVIVNRTTRYHCSGINYKFLAKKANTVFIGYPDEYRAFARQCPGIPHVQPDDGLAFARMVKACRLYIGNQSFGFCLAEAMKKPRLVEMFAAAPNVTVHGPNGRQFVNQSTFERMFHLMTK